MNGPPEREQRWEMNEEGELIRRGNTQRPRPQVMQVMKAHWKAILATLILIVGISVAGSVIKERLQTCEEGDYAYVKPVPGVGESIRCIHDQWLEDDGEVYDRERYIAEWKESLAQREEEFVRRKEEEGRASLEYKAKAEADAKAQAEWEAKAPEREAEYDAKRAAEQASRDEYSSCLENYFNDHGQEESFDYDNSGCHEFIYGERLDY